MQLVTLGEILIDFLQIQDEEGLPTFIAQPGGAPANVACAAAKLGVQTAFIGKVGDDQFGQQLTRTLTSQNVDSQHVVTSAQSPTTLAFVHIAQDGDRSFSFYRQGCADTQLTKADIDGALLQSCEVFHFGSNSMTEPCSAEATLYALRLAKQSGALISFDPNVREKLWADVSAIRPMIEQVLADVDVLKVSEEELQLLTDVDDVEEGLFDLQSRFSIPLIVVTLGASGVYYRFNHKTEHIDGHTVEAIDTTGAGDSFVGAMLSQLIAAQIPMQQLDAIGLQKMLAFANAAAALSTTKNGAIPSYPTLQQVENLLKQK